LIDRQLKKMMNGQNVQLVRGNVMDLDRTNKYDFVLLHNMLVSPRHFRKFGLEPTNLDDLMEKCKRLLTPVGVQATIGYESAGEYDTIVEHIPEERRVAEFRYKVELGNEGLNEIFTPGMFREYRSGICISKK